MEWRLRDSDTIFGLSSGALPSGVAVIRVSGSRCRHIAEVFGFSLPCSNDLGLRSVYDPKDGSIIDRGLVVFFEGPNSFTGEDCLELQLHGSRAIVSAIFRMFSEIENVRAAEAGEFTRRAFINGKMDLTAAEALSDLIVAQTEQQRILAVSHSMGASRKIYENWRTRLVRVLALFAAEIDFVEEEDVPDDISHDAMEEITRVREEICRQLDDHRYGEIIQDGFRIAIMGKPNSGKSSLLNALAKRDVAIVTDVAGTTRDVLEINLDISGYHVVVSDTAGIRETTDIVEIEGIRRAEKAGENADLIIWLIESKEDLASEFFATLGSDKNLVLLSKDDAGLLGTGQSVSSESGYGLDWLIEEIGERLAVIGRGQEAPLITRQRHRESLRLVHDCLVSVSKYDSDKIEFIAEELRAASYHLGKITGVIDVEDLLDVIFSEFCVGK